MKKILTLLAAIVLLAGAVSARDMAVRNFDALPEAAKKFIRANFPKQKIHHIKMDRKLFSGSDIEVVLSNGTEIDFDSNGNWKEVDCGYDALPDVFLLKNIRSYIKSSYPGKKAVKIEKKRNEYEVELSNGVDLIFNRDGSFSRIDD